MNTKINLRSYRMKNVSRDTTFELPAVVTTFSDNPISVKVNLNVKKDSTSYLIITNLSLAVINELKQKKLYFKIRINKIEDKYTDFISATYNLLLKRLIFFDTGNNFTDLNNDSDIKFIEDLTVGFPILQMYKSYKVNALNIYDSDKENILFSYMSPS